MVTARVTALRVKIAVVTVISAIFSFLDFFFLFKLCIILFLYLYVSCCSRDHLFFLSKHWFLNMCILHAEGYPGSEP